MMCRLEGWESCLSLLNDSLTTMMHRHIALLAESKACADRRHNPSYHVRNPKSKLYSYAFEDDSTVPKSSRMSSAERELPTGSSSLTEMNSAVAAQMMREDEIALIPKVVGVIRHGDWRDEDPRGNNLFLDSMDVGQNSEYEHAPDDIIKRGDEQDCSDSTCWRPELPSPVLLDYLRMLASQRFQSDYGKPRDSEQHSSSDVEEQPAGELRQDYSGNEDHKPDPLAYSLSSSAIVAVGILFEELTAEFMESWKRRHHEATGKCESVQSIDDLYTGKKRRRKRNIRKHTGGGPIGPLSIRALAIEARLQLKGAKFFSDDDNSPPMRNKSSDEVEPVIVWAKSLSRRKRESIQELRMKKSLQERKEVGPDCVTPSLLQNRLEVLFGQDLSKYSKEIGLIFLQERLEVE